MDFRQVQADIVALLADSPITKESIRADVREYVRVGEIGLAFDTLCTWLYEDSLPISRAYYERLAAMSAELEDPESLERLDELIAE